MADMSRHAGIIVIILLSLVMSSSLADQTLIAPGSSWKYNDTGTDLGTAWRNPAYNDAAWASGLAELGYGDGGESTVLSYGASSTAKYITYYFRRSFNLANPAALATLSVRFVRDDGCVIYLNGTEVVRSNMPAGAITSSTLAVTAIADAAESAWQQVQIDPPRRVRGSRCRSILRCWSPART
jgi:hypothetical protein